MVKKSKTIYVLGSIIIALASLFLVYFLLIVTGVIMVKEETLIITSGSTTVTYNGEEIKCEEIEILDGKLNDDHKIEAVFTGKITNVGSVLNTYNFSIVDSMGANVTSKYKVQKVEGTITVNKRPITLKATDASKVYDGTPLKSYSDSYLLVSGALVQGHSVSVKSLGEQTDSGIGKNDLAYTIFDMHKTDVTSNYDVTVIPGALVVNPIKLTISSGSGTKFYDGNPLVIDECKIDSGELLDSDGDGVSEHRLEFKTTSSLTEPGEIENEFVCTIIDIETNEDVTSNYEILPNYGTLIVTTEELYFKGEYLTRDYCGEEIVFEEFNVLPDEETVEILNKYNYSYEIVCKKISEINVGEYDLEYSVIIYNSEGKDITEYCAFNNKEGSLNIIPKIINITTPLLAYEYNGKIEEITNKDYVFDGLLDIHEAIYEVQQYNMEDYLEALKYDEELKNKPIDIKIVDSNGTEVTDNYKILDSGLGNFKLLQKSIGIVSSNKKEVYDKEELIYEEVTLICGEEVVKNDPTLESNTYNLEFLGDHVLEIIFDNSKKLIDVGSRKNNFDYKIYDKDNNDVTELFNVHKEVGNLEVEPFKIKINTPSATKVYDGKPLSNINYTIDPSVFIDNGITDISELGIKLEVTDFTEVTDVAEGSVKNVLSIDVIDLDTNEINENYDVSFNQGKLSITPYFIKIKTGNMEREYTGEQFTGKTEGLDIYEANSYGDLNKDSSLTYTNHKENNISLSTGHTLYISDIWTSISIGYIINKPASFMVYDEEGNEESYYISNGVVDGKSNYIIKEEYGYISVYEANYDFIFSPFPIVYSDMILSVLNPLTIEGAFNENFIYENISVGGTLASEYYINGYSVDVVFDIYDSDGNIITGVTEPGIYTTRINSLVLKDENGNDITNTYKIKLESSYIKIYLYKAEITTVSASKEYDGLDLEGTLDYSITGLNYGHSIQVLSTEPNKIKDIGKIYNSFDYKIVDSDGNDVSYLYGVTEKWGLLSVSPKVITLTFNDDVIITLPSGQNVVTNEDFEIGQYHYSELLNGHVSFSFETGEITDTGPTEISKFKVLDENGEDVTKYYTLEVTNSFVVIVE